MSYNLNDNKKILKEFCNAIGEDLTIRNDSLTTLKKIVMNALLDDDKYRVLNKSNLILAQKLFKYNPQCEKLFSSIGFQGENDTLVLKQDSFDRSLLEKMIDLISKQIEIIANSLAVQPPIKKQRGGSSNSKNINLGNSSSSSSTTSSKAISVIHEPDNQHTTVPAATHEDLSNITIFCDSCGKARILSKNENESVCPEGNISDIDFKCTALERLKNGGGCSVPDDELVVIVGAGFAQVLDKLEITTRAKLAASLATDFDAGEWADQIERWIERAQALELEDIMADILVSVPSDAISNLRELGISSPSDLIDHKPEAIVNLWSTRLKINENTFVPDAALVEQWQNISHEKLEELPWLKNWSALHSLEFGDDMAFSSPKIAEA